MVSYSKSQEAIFEQRLASQMNKKSTIYIRDLVSFEWDTVCVMGGYSHLREDMALPNFYGKDIPELELFPNVNELASAFIFLKKDKLVAVINHFEPRYRYGFTSCSNADGAVFKLINSKAFVPLEILKANNYRVRPVDLKKYEGCIGTNCELTFYGDRP